MLKLSLLVYPWGNLPDGAVLCDLGGNNGYYSLQLLKSFPHLKIVLQDLPPVVEQGRQVSILWFDCML